MRKEELVTIAQADAIIKEKKVTVRSMEWQEKPQKTSPQWYEFFSACEIKSEIYEDLMFRSQYRAQKTVIHGMATINYDETFSVAIHLGNHRILALDYTTTKHTNKVGEGRSFYKKSFSEPHLHIWTEKGYGYAEPFPLKETGLEYITECFLGVSNLEIYGGFVHPLKGKQLDLPI